MKKKTTKARNTTKRRHGLVNSAFLGQGRATNAVGLLDAQVNKAVELYNQQQFASAEQVLLAADVGTGQHRLGMHVLALICAQTLRQAQAETLWQKMLQVFNKPSEVYPNYGRLLQLQGRYDESLAVFSAGLPANENDYTTHLNLGVLLHHMHRYGDAVKHADKAIALNPNDAQAHFNKGRFLTDMDDLPQALACLKHALKLEPTHARAYGNLLFNMNYMAQYSPADIYQTAVQYGAAFNQLANHSAQLLPLPTTARAKRKIGLLSADLRMHPVGWFMLNLLTHIDYSRFELVVFANTRQMDTLSEKLKAYCSAWHFIEHLTDATAAELIAAEALDVLLDLAGVTGGNRLKVLTYKPARKIVNWLGYFGTTGLAAVDFILADPYCVPEHEEGLYSETVLRLPATRMCMTPPEGAPAVNGLPALNHPNQIIQLASFQEINKLGDDVLRLWWQLMQAHPNIHLRLQTKRLGNDFERTVLQQRLLGLGYDLSRVQMFGPVSRDEYLAVYGSVDLIVDTFPYPGGTTTAEALWMGVPTLTLTGVGMLQRQGESLLNNVGLSDWVCYSTAELQQKFSSIVSPSGLQALAQVRQNLRGQCTRSVLFDGQLFAQHWMAAMDTIAKAP